jgi:hypothetical protein
MPRLLLVLLVGLLSVTTSGVLELVVSEQCIGTDTASSQGDGTCPPTCLRCHCARPYDVVAAVLLPETPLTPIEWADPVPVPVLASPNDVLHVPRPVQA